MPLADQSEPAADPEAEPTEADEAEEVEEEPTAPAEGEAVVDVGAEGGGDAVDEEVEMADEEVQERLKRSIVAMLADPNAGDLSLGMVKQRLKDELGKTAVKVHKDFIRDYVKQEVLRLQAEAEQGGDGSRADDAPADAPDDDAEAEPAPAEGEDVDEAAAEAETGEGDSRRRRSKPRRRREGEGDEEKVDRRDAEDEDYQEETPRKRRIPLKAKAAGRKGGVGGKTAAGKRVGPMPARSAYLMFSQARREGVKKENPYASFGEVSKMIGEQWKELDEEERRTWATESEKDKERYQQEMEQLRETDPDRYEEALREGKGKGKGKKKARGAAGEDDAEEGERPKKKKRKSDSDSEGGGGGEGGEEAKEVSYFDSILAKLKTRRQTKSLYDEDDTKEMCKRFLHRMDEAWKMDTEALAADRPAVAKLKMLEEVQAQVGKKEVADRLIDHGLLKVIRKWYTPPPLTPTPPLSLHPSPPPASPSLTLLLSVRPCPPSPPSPSHSQVDPPPRWLPTEHPPPLCPV